MVVRTACPHCAKSFQVAESALGRRGRCKACNTLFTIEPAQGRSIAVEATMATLPAPSGSAAHAAAAASVQDGGHREWRIGDVIGGLYEVKGILGQGGMGKVFRVYHRGWDLDLALKSPLPDQLVRPGATENFERECETWVNLGLHPHIVTCYYVRRIGGLPLVFAECVTGGDLQAWIRDGRLYAGGHKKSLRRILDIAIQFAWGLHYAHQHGLIHQDVKPSNVMMLPDGATKVTDFGLAKARAISGVGAAAGAEQSILVSSGGMTPAYCSPEQASHAKLSRKTDIWSWGLSILEMFTGDVIWRSGTLARSALEEYLEDGAESDAAPPMPTEVADLLLQCFQQNPQERPRDLAAVADSLMQNYREVAGRAYHRSLSIKGQTQADALNNRALSFWDLGRQQEALSLWEEALKCDPHHLHATYNRGLVLWRQAQLTDDVFVQQLEEMRKSHTDNWEDEYLLARVHLERGAVEEAGALLDLCAPAGSSSPEVTAALDIVDSLRCHQLVRTLHGNGLTQDNVAFSRNGRLAVTFKKEAALLEVWDVATGQLHTLPGNEAPLITVVLNSTGALAMSAGQDQNLILWDVAARGIRLTFESRTEGVTALAISPNDQLAVSANKTKLVNGILRVWRMDTGRCLHTIQTKSGAARRLAFSPDSRLVASASEDQLVRLWDLRAGTCLRNFEGHQGPVSALLFSPDGGLLLSAGADRTIRVWEIASGRCISVFQGHTQEVSTLALDFDAQWVLSGSSHHEYRVWEMRSGQCIFSFGVDSASLSAAASRLGRLLRLEPPPTDDARACQQSTGIPRSLAASSDGRFLVTGGLDTPLRLWDVEAGMCVRTLDKPGDPIQHVSFTDDGRFFLAVTTGEAFHIWELGGTVSAPLAAARPARSEEVQERESEFRKLLGAAQEAWSRREMSQALQLVQKARSTPGFERDARAMAILTRLAAVGRRTQLVGGWHARTLEGHTEAVNCVAFSPDGRLALTGSADCALRLWNVQTGQCLDALSEHRKQITQCAICPDGQLAVSAGADQVLRLWDLAAKKSIRTFGRASAAKMLEWEDLHTAPVMSLAVGPDGRCAMAGTADNMALLWDLGTGQCLRKFSGPSGKASVVHSLAFSPDGEFVLAGSSDEHIWRLELATRQLRPFAATQTVVKSVAISSDGRLVVSGGADGALCLFNASSGQCHHRLVDHQGPIESVAISADGRYVLSGGGDATLRLWAVATSECLRVFEGHSEAVVAVAFSPDCRFALSGSCDKTTRLWELDWELQIPRSVYWDDAAMPYLEQFLRLLETPRVSDQPEPDNKGEFLQRMLRRFRSPSPADPNDAARSIAARPIWNATDFRRLLQQLQRHGLGWIQPDGVRRKLEELAANWRPSPPLRKD